ncbi:TIGR04086 family membrane protein [Alkalibacillus haloalkaliphilus]|uniref:Putative membrane protein YrzE n=1 Tax=Alkalibacillus haloalkaliphilus TaxID=94136 RepID=A0A511W5P8_9BACI|nr:TIGR04086 family membrane protein [Alkalibacillus haloalkaliphilus]GEN46429.1 putative membrane protein YrzE [Alkalibacillus haloalkaliphilus]
MNERLKATFYGLTAILVLMLVASLVFALFINFDWMATSTLQWVTFITSIVIMLIGGFISGRMTVHKGWVTGAIVGIIYVVGIMLYQFLAHDSWIQSYQILYFLIFIVATVTGSILGVNMQRRSEAY